MNILRRSLLLCALTSPFAAPAFAQGDVQDRLYDLARDIQREVPRARGTYQQLLEAETKMLEALDLLRGRDPGPGQQTFITVDDLLVVVGSHEQYDSSTAMNAWQASCNQTEQFLRTLYGNGRIQSFSCGSPANISPWSSQSYYLYASTVSAVILSPEEALEQSDQTLSGDNLQYDVDRAYQTWAERCKQRMQSVRSSYGNRFAAASCGQPRNVSPWASQGYYQFQSTTKLWLTSL